jgi:diguanylate cyclase (GGDEF)-like protein
MVSIKEILLIAALACLVIFLVLYSVKGCRVKGSSELMLANLFGAVSYVLYAFDDALPAILSYEGANSFYAAAGASAFVGFRRLLEQPVSLRAVGTAVALVAVAAAIFHYAFYSFSLRTAVVSGFMAVVTAGITYTVLRAHARLPSARYALGFSALIAATISVGHAARAILHLVSPSAPKSLLEPNAWNQLFLALGAFSLPVLTLGGLLVVHRMVVWLAEEAANRDFLTGVWTRRAFFEIAEREVARANRSKRPLAIIALDLDHFKSVNDRFGHAAGDRTLNWFVDTVGQCLRTSDYFARLGGDEFAIVMVDTDHEGACRAAQRLRTRLNEESQKAPYAVSASAGLAFMQEGDSIGTLLERADAALYEAKKAGRNRTVIGTDSVLEADAGL